MLPDWAVPNGSVFLSPVISKNTSVAFQDFTNLIIMKHLMNTSPLGVYQKIFNFTETSSLTFCNS